MTGNRSQDLLVDLARLIKKHGPEAFEDLAKEFRNAATVELFAEVLKSTASLHRANGAPPNKRFGNPERRLASSLRQLGVKDAEKAALLTDLYDGLKSKALLRTLREMQNFASDNGLPQIKSKSRDKALIPFIKTFFPMPIDEIRQYVQRAQATSTQSSGLEGWSDIIFGNKKRISSAES